MKRKAEFDLDRNAIEKVLFLFIRTPFFPGRTRLLRSK